MTGDCDASVFHRDGSVRATAYRRQQIFGAWAWLKLCTPCAVRIDWEPAYVMDRVPLETMQRVSGVSW